MKHLSQILILDTDIPKQFINAIIERFSTQIEIIVVDKNKDFADQISDSNIVICNTRYIKNFDIDCAKISIVTHNDFPITNPAIDEFVFDPFKNEDRDKQDYLKSTEAFCDLVSYAVTEIKIPLTPDDTVSTIIELD